MRTDIGDEGEEDGTYGMGRLRACLDLGCKLIKYCLWFYYYAYALFSKHTFRCSPSNAGASQLSTFFVFTFSLTVTFTVYSVLCYVLARKYIFRIFVDVSFHTNQ